MNTAVQLRQSAGSTPSADLVAGVPWRLVDGQRGAVALFRPGALVAYRLGVDRRRVSLFVFRTLEGSEARAARVPGISPRVRLLATVRSARNLRRLEGLFADIAREGRDPRAYPDTFYVRLGVLLAGRCRERRVLGNLLQRKSQDEWL